jgi:oligopeptide transport system substrate-binding protein
LLLKLGQTYHSANEHGRAAVVYREAFQYADSADRDLPTKLSLATPATFRFPMSARPFVLDSSRTNSYADQIYIEQLFSGLLQLSPDLDVLPDIAVSWSISDDGLEYNFQLRDDVLWSDGQPVTAYDFECAWRRILAPGHTSPNAGLFGDIRDATRFRAGETDELGIKVIDDRTLHISLEQPAAYFLHLLAFQGYPVPRHAIEVYGEAWSKPANIVTNGRFILVRWPKDWCEGESVLLSQNPTYHGQFSGNVAHVEIELFRSTEAALRAYEGDRLHFCALSTMYYLEPLPVKLFRQGARQHSAELRSQTIMATDYIGFTTSRPPFDDTRVRRAFALALDRNRMRDERRDVVHGGFVPPGMPGHVPDIALPYDLEEARRLLVVAGYPGGHDLPIIKARAAKSYREDAEHIAALWRDGLGASVQLELSDRLLIDHSCHLFLDHWIADYPDPDNHLRVGVGQLSDWYNDKYESITTRAKSIMDRQERMRLYRQAEELLVAETPIIPTYYPKWQLLVKPWIKNWRFDQFGHLNVHYIVVEPH